MDSGWVFIGILILVAVWLISSDSDDSESYTTPTPTTPYSRPTTDKCTSCQGGRLKGHCYTCGGYTPYKCDVCKDNPYVFGTYQGLPVHYCERRK